MLFTRALEKKKRQTLGEAPFLFALMANDSVKQDQLFISELSVKLLAHFLWKYSYIYEFS